MEWIINNWALVLGIAAIAIAAGFYAYKFLGLPTPVQISKVKEWLLYAVTMAEAELGSGTGQLKLRMVYDMFITRFPLVAKIVSFETFSAWVDEALVEMKKMLNTNFAIAEVVYGVVGGTGETNEMTID
jgi:hypothetical protein